MALDRDADDVALLAIELRLGEHHRLVADIGEEVFLADQASAFVEAQHREARLSPELHRTVDFLYPYIGAHAVARHRGQHLLQRTHMARRWSAGALEMGRRLLRHAIFEHDRVGRHVHALENERVGRLGCRDEEVDGFGPGRDRLYIYFALFLGALHNDYT